MGDFGSSVLLISQYGLVTDVSALDLEYLKSWIGKTWGGKDVLTSRLVAELRATLQIPLASRITADPSACTDRTSGDSGAAPPPYSPSVTSQELPAAPQWGVPATIHWCLAPQIEPISSLGDDGHPVRGGFLPPVPLRRRMWAGGEVSLFDSLRIGDEVERVSRIANVEARTGRTGKLCFVTVLHDLSTDRGPAVHEKQVLVYRASADSPPRVAAAGSQPQPTSASEPEANTPPRSTGTAIPEQGSKPRWQLALRTDPVLLFRYSALTFNGHRIHYDRDYCRSEGYPGLLVHAPLQASLLAEFAALLRNGTPVRHFVFRAVRPLFDNGAITLNACDSPDGLDLWVCDGAGMPTLTAVVK